VSTKKPDLLHKNIFDFPCPPTLGTRPLETIPHPWARKAGLVQRGCPDRGGGMVTGKIEPCTKLKWWT